MGKYIRGAVDEELSLTTLGPKTVAQTPFDQTVVDRMLVSSIVATYSMKEFTQGADDGPILVGIAHSDYTASEIEEWIENLGSWAESDLVGQEVNSRKCRLVGQFDTPSSATETVVLNDGKPIKSKLNWILNQGQTLDLWGYNLGTSALATTVPIVRANGHVNLWAR